MSTLSTALEWHHHGLSCLPCYPGSKALLRGIRTSQPVEFADLLRWFAKGFYNIALRTGEAKDGRHLVILDFDNFEDWITWYSQTKIISYSITTNRGKHVYLWSKEPVPLDAKNDLCEIKANGSVCLTAGSVIDGVERKGRGEIEEVRSIGEVLTLSPSKEKNITVNIYGTVIVGSSFTRRSSVVANIKAAYPITSIFRDYQSSGDGMAMARCPMSAHQNGDSHPSLSLDLQSNRFKCFKPGCPLSLPRGGDVIDAYRILNRMSFRATLAAMAEELGL